MKNNQSVVDVEKQRDEMIKNIDSLVTIASSLPIPGLEIVLKPVSALFKSLEPSPYREIIEKLDQANARLSNMFNVNLAADRLNDMENFVISQKGIAQLVYNMLTRDDRIYDGIESGPLNYEELQKSQTKMHLNVVDSCRKSLKVLSGYESLRSNDQGTILEYVMNFNAAIYMAYEIVGLAQYTFNNFVEHNLELDKKGINVTPDDLKLGNKACINSSDCSNDFKMICIENVPTYYPKWCIQIFTNEYFSMRSDKNKDRCITHPKATGNDKDLKLKPDKWKTDSKYPNNLVKCSLAPEDEWDTGSVWHLEGYYKPWFIILKENGELYDDVQPLYVNKSKLPNNTTKKYIFQLTFDKKHLQMKAPDNKQSNVYIGVWSFKHQLGSSDFWTETDSRCLWIITKEDQPL